MKALSLEFGNVRRRAPWWSFVLFVVGLLASMAGVWRLGLAQAQLSELRATAEKNAALAAPSRPHPLKQPALALAPGQVKAINYAINALNVPWNGLFERLEAVRSRDVALLALEPDSATATVRLSGEARDAASMLAFVNRLGASDVFGPGVMLVKHELNVQDADQPYRFEIQARWGEGR